ncbi:hypothetical protein I7I51_06637 [Histoplasma capsulatum]|uniref:Major facilitator superfamily (MFS) profile domain-containing protein n=1 Tax=Ajellomyces capsulatus TaxID=5037 RepID=A0A8A1MGQ1_AJECA|nr:hypothetical protein I7I51_06637 [Histoplasma capsulatum]
MTVHELGYEMDTYLDEACETAVVDANMESEPFLASIPSSTTSWVAPKGFIWIEIAIFANVFLSGFDGTITASTYAVISSEFNAANNASWLTTSYLITSTVFQPLYGRFSDIFGRRACFFTSTITFMLGCLGCALAPNIVVLNLMRAVTGLGGALQDSNSLTALCAYNDLILGMYPATIINSDMIPFKERGMYQAVQNVLHGFGSICGASIGGSIADTIGWRWCFLLQVPVSILALVVGHLVVINQSHYQNVNREASKTTLSAIWNRVDLSGSFLLIVGLSSQLVGLGLGDHAVSASTVYLIRSLGTVWGVAITSAITQNTLKKGLPEALIGIPDKWKIIEEIRHSVLAINKLPLDAQLAARHVYHHGINLSFAVSAGFGFIATVSALFASGKGLSRRTSSDTRMTASHSQERGGGENIVEGMSR